MAGVMEAIVGGGPEPFGFDAGLRAQSLVEAVPASGREGGWRDAPA